MRANTVEVEGLFDKDTRYLVPIFNGTTSGTAKSSGSRFGSMYEQWLPMSWTRTNGRSLTTSWVRSSANRSPSMAATLKHRVSLTVSSA